MKYTILPEFETLLPRQLEDERRRHAVAIETDGARPGSVVLAQIPNDGTYVVDGHHTLRVCDEKGLARPEPVVIAMPDRETAMDWIVNNQLAKRNLTDEQRAYYIGKKYLQEKTHQGGSRSNRHSDGLVDHQTGSQSAAQRIGSETHASPRTVERNAAFAEAVDQQPPKARAAILAGAAGVSKQQVIDTPPELLFCPRCQSDGPVMNCERCAALRRSAAATNGHRADSPTKNGQVRFDWKVFRDDFGRLMRQIDKLGIALGCNDQPPCDAMRELLSDFHEQAKVLWKQKTNEEAPDA
jgi:hypothetical protein